MPSSLPIEISTSSALRDSFFFAAVTTPVIFSTGCRNGALPPSHHWDRSCSYEADHRRRASSCYHSAILAESLRRTTLLIQQIIFKSSANRNAVHDAVVEPQIFTASVRRFGDAGLRFLLSNGQVGQMPVSLLFGVCQVTQSLSFRLVSMPVTFASAIWARVVMAVSSAFKLSDSCCRLRLLLG